MKVLSDRDVVVAKLSTGTVQVPVSYCPCTGDKLPGKEGEVRGGEGEVGGGASEGI